MCAILNSAQDPPSDGTLVSLYILEASLKKCIEKMWASLRSSQVPPSDGTLVCKTHQIMCLLCTIPPSQQS